MIEAGGLAFRYRGQDVLAPAGWVNLAFPGEAHTGQAADAAGWTYRMFYLDPAFMAEIARSLDPRAREMPFIPAGAVWDPALAGRLARLHRACEAPDAEPLVRETRLALLLQDVLSRYAAPGQAPPRCRAEVARARRFLEDHLPERISLQELGDLVGMNPYVLARCFTRELGMPPHACLVQARVRRAAELLRQGTAPALAALEVGFADQSHLNRHFLRCYGLTPGQFRRARRP